MKLKEKLLEEWLDDGMGDTIRDARERDYVSMAYLVGFNKCRELFISHFEEIREPDPYTSTDYNSILKGTMNDLIHMYRELGDEEV